LIVIINSKHAACLSKAGWLIKIHSESAGPVARMTARHRHPKQAGCLPLPLLLCYGCGAKGLKGRSFYVCLLLCSPGHRV